MMNSRAIPAVRIVSIGTRRITLSQQIWSLTTLKIWVSSSEFNLLTKLHSKSSSLLEEGSNWFPALVLFIKFSFSVATSFSSEYFLNKIITKIRNENLIFKFWMRILDVRYVFLIKKKAFGLHLHMN